jgi:hypothetical protein
MATGTSTIDFGSTPTDNATILVTGQTGLTTSSHLEAFIQSADTSTDNDAQSHRQFAYSAKLSCEYVSDTSFYVNADLMIGLAMGTFKLHYATV